MTPDLLRTILDCYPNALRVMLIGIGEPLLSPHLSELVGECVKRRMIVDTVSNGVALDAHTPEILRWGLDRLCVSVNGHTAEDFHRLTGMPEASFSKILRNVQNLVRARSDNKAMIRIEISFIVDTGNYRHLGEMMELAESLGVDGANFYNFLPTPYPGFTPEERCLYEDDPGVQEELGRLMSKIFRCDVTWPRLLKRHGERRTICTDPFTLLQVDGDGNVGGCSIAMLNMHENGKIWDKNPWNNEYFRDLRRRHLNGDLLWPCKYCGKSAGVEPSHAARSILSQNQT